jgi:hypothetical protein
MLGFINISPKVKPLAPQNAGSKERLSLAVGEAIVLAVRVAFLALGFGVQLWIYLPRGLLQ